ncbi:hypothetical protein Plec18167_005464 [Paecilomyces lecythidis]|uniref:Uncharacterized protein n=1 Tax=Paecilomyces lecythidis TaxID=3004212 RepID=A0ABR3XHT6_9EURO
MTKATRRSGKDKSSASGYASKTTTVNSKQEKPLTPFVKAPSDLQPFLEPLSPKEVYLIHIDRSPIELKKQIFIVPIIINVLITALIAWRVYKGLAIYPPLLVTALGFTSSMNVDTSAISWEEIGGHILRRAGTFLVDYMILSLLLPWPIRFIRGPVRWRCVVGFREREVIVRQSQRSWSEKLEPNKWIYEDVETVQQVVVPAVTPEKILKSGYLLVDAHWDLDYEGMIRAHELVDKTRKGEGVPLDEFRTAVLVHMEDEGWLIWRVADEETDEERKTQRDKIVLFKDKLTLMGKESLFFRWVELIQYESTQPGGFTPERQRSAMVQAREMFENEGIDFSKFWQEVGGIEGLPGFEG